MLRCYTKYEACVTETHLRMITGEGTTTVKKNHHRHLDRNPSDAQVSIFYLQSIPLAAAWATVLTAPCTLSLCVNLQLLRAIFNGPSMWKSKGDESRLYAGCLSTSHCMVVKWSWTLCHVAVAFSWTGCSHQWVYQEICSWLYVQMTMHLWLVNKGKTN